MISLNLTFSYISNYQQSRFRHTKSKHFCFQGYRSIQIYGHLNQSLPCTTIHRYPIFSARYSVIYKVYTRYHGTSEIERDLCACTVYTRYHGKSEIEHGLCACTVDNPLAKARGLSLRTGAQKMLYLSLIFK